MNTRTFAYALLAVLALPMMGAAAAQSETPTTTPEQDPASAGVEHDAKPSEGASPALATFAIAIAPEAQRAKPGDDVRYHVVAKARSEMTLKLGIGASVLPDGFVAALENETLALRKVPCPTAASSNAAPNATNDEARCSYYHAATTLRVKLPERPTVDGVRLEVHATNEAGERHAAHAKLGIVPPPHPCVAAAVAAAASSAKPEPAACGKPRREADGTVPHDASERIRALEERIRALEQREKMLREQLRLKEELLARLASERPAATNGTIEPYALAGAARLTLAPMPHGGWRAFVADEHGRVLGGNARLFLLMEVAGGPGPADG